jgi:hypothetical protein
VVAAVGWLVPGEVRHFPLAQREAAIRWAAGTDEVAGAVGSPMAATAPEPSGPEAVTTEAAEAAEVEPTTEPSPAVDPTVVMASRQLPHHQTLVPTAPLNPNAEVRAGVITGPQVATSAVPAQWAADPYGRHQHRWWDGERWTAYVADHGVTTTDPHG